MADGIGIAVSLFLGLGALWIGLAGLWSGKDPVGYGVVCMFGLAFLIAGGVALRQAT